MRYCPSTFPPHPFSGQWCISHVEGVIAIVLCILLLPVAAGSNEGASARCWCCRCYHAAPCETRATIHTNPSERVVARGSRGDREQTGGGIKLITSSTHTDTIVMLAYSPRWMGQRRGGATERKLLVRIVVGQTNQDTQGRLLVRFDRRVGLSTSSTSMFPGP